MNEEFKAMTVKEVIEKLSQYPENTKIFSYNEDDCLWSRGVLIWEEKEFDGIAIQDAGEYRGYWFDGNIGKYIWTGS